ncbi:MAG: winged helix-turn-helix transcriptional regulator [Thaumarchaeota archaeon]|nr:winged helix-turn-helix transcriptional regulator [Nitrososphaerota archaeon]
MLFAHIFVNSRGGPVRIKIISLLRRGSLNAYQLSTALEMDYQTIRHHGAVLEKNNLVSKDNTGYGASYFITSLLEVNMDVFDEILSKYALLNP